MQAVIYSNGSQECERAGMLLKSVHEDFHEYFLDKDFTDKQFHAEFGSNAEYPQISIGLKHRGGLKETLHYMNTNDMLTHC
tara:strand:- start:1237 stop:1479 length:243 start_codon:yes stop_codon:yes gene_type:complete